MLAAASIRLPRRDKWWPFYETSGYRECAPSDAGARPRDLPNRVAAVDEDGRAGDKVGSARSEKNRRPGAFIRRAEAAGRRALDDLVVERASFDRRGHLALDPSWHHRVDLYVMRRQLDRHRLGQLHEPALGRGVGGRDRIAEERVLARDVDDLATPSRRHRACRDLRE